MTHPIVACARGWIGTRFHHQGRVKKTHAHKGGVDCLGLLVGVAAELHLCGRDGLPLMLADECHYSHSPDTRYLRRRLADLLLDIPVSQANAGDVLLLSVDGNPQHLAITSELGNMQGLIHAYAPARAVIEHHLDTWWMERIEAVFRIV